MAKIRFAHVIDGSNRNPLLYNSIKYSDRERFEYCVITLQPAGELQQQMASLGVRSFSLDYLSRRNAVSALYRLIRYFRKENIQIVQTHLFDASLIALTAAKIVGTPVKVFTGHHSHEVPLHERKFLTFVDGISAKLLSDHSIAPSQQMKDIWISDFGVPPAKIAVVHHGFDLHAWRLAAARPAGLRKRFEIEDKLVLGAVGRLWWVKGFETLIRAFASVSKDRTDIALVIVGGGDTADLQAVIDKERVNERVFLAGRSEEIASEMSEFDVFVHSSLAESFGMVFIEAFALGIPIVSTPVGVAPEIIRDGVTGFLSNGTDRSSIKATLRKMLEVQEDWKKMGRRGSEIANRFDVRLTQAECDKLYIEWLKQT